MHDLVTVEFFDLEKTYEYILSIQVSLNGFSFCIKLPEGGQILAYKTTPLKISSNSVLNRHFSEWLQKEELLQKPFKKVRIIILNEYFSLIPEFYFQDSMKNLLSKFLFEENTNFELAENVIHALKSKLIFALPPEINETIQKNIGECEIVHPIKLIVNNLPEISKENGLILLFDTKNFYVVLFNRESVLLTNNFKMTHVNDVIYYVLTLLRQMNTQVKETSVFFTNTANHSIEFHESLKTTFPYLIVLDRETKFSNSQQTIQFTHFCN